MSLVFGTHTHVPTSDGRILLKGTAYQTDLGMTGPRELGFGTRLMPVSEGFWMACQENVRVAEGDVGMQGCLLDLSDENPRSALFNRKCRL